MGTSKLSRVRGAGLSYDINDSLTVRINVTNLLETYPPMMFRN